MKARVADSRRGSAAAPVRISSLDKDMGGLDHHLLNENLLIGG